MSSPNWQLPEQRSHIFADYLKSLVQDEDCNYNMHCRFDDSKHFLMEHTHLACEETATYLTIQCINLAMEEVGSAG